MVYVDFIRRSFRISCLLQLDRTPLQWACAKGNPTIVELLIEAGADLEAKDKVWLQIRNILSRGTTFHTRIACAANEDSDQPAHPRSLIRVFAVRMKILFSTG